MCECEFGPADASSVRPARPARAPFFRSHLVKVFCALLHTPLELLRSTVRVLRPASTPYRPRSRVRRSGSSTTPRSTADMAAVAMPMSIPPLHDSPVVPSVSAPFKPALERKNSPPYSPLCWGHRGVSVQARVRLQVLTGPNRVACLGGVQASAAYPENTLASFEAAIRDGADGIESGQSIRSLLARGPPCTAVEYASMHPMSTVGLELCVPGVMLDGTHVAAAQPLQWRAPVAAANRSPRAASTQGAHR